MNKRTLSLVSGVAVAALGALVLSPVSANADETTTDDDFSTTIINGQPAEEGQFPYMVTMARSGFPELNFCGGALIAEDVVLTAAHCVENSVGSYIIRHGSVDLNSDNMENYEVADDYVAADHHEPIQYANDWALIKLVEPVPDAEVLLLPDDDSFDDGPTLTVAGWGRTETGWGVSELRYVDVPYVDDHTCATNFGEAIHFESMLCAGDMDEGGVDACSGDSGGPLVNHDDDGNAVSVGIVSWGEGCAEPGYPGVYAQTSYFLDTIHEVMESW